MRARSVALTPESSLPTARLGSRGPPVFVVGQTQYPEENISNGYCSRGAGSGAEGKSFNRSGRNGKGKGMEIRDRGEGISRLSFIVLYEHAAREIARGTTPGYF